MTFDALLFAYLLTTDIDRHQTLQIQHRPEIHEINPVLGSHPDTGRVNRYFAVTTVATVALAEAIPEYRTTILGAATAVHVLGIGKNRSLGLTIGF